AYATGRRVRIEASADVSRPRGVVKAAMSRTSHGGPTSQEHLRLREGSSIRAILLICTTGVPKFPKCGRSEPQRTDENTTAVVDPVDHRRDCPACSDRKCG